VRRAIRSPLDDPPGAQRTGQRGRERVIAEFIADRHLVHDGTLLAAIL
jgi:hypothetical protein